MVFFNCGFIGIKGIISDLVKEKLKDIHGNKYSDDNYSYSYNGYLSLMDYYYTIMMDNAGMANDLVHWFINMTVLRWHCLYYFCQHPPLQRSVEYIMSEVMISRRGGVDPNAGKIKELKTVNVTYSRVFTVPEGAINNEFSIRLFGGGGGGCNSKWGAAGGGSSWMNNDVLILIPNDIISINIGYGGSVLANGATTSFGTYLSANGGGAALSIGLYPAGGNGGSGGYGTGNGGKGYQFGGGGSNIYTGGDGGVWGGGGGGNGGGNGGTYGGGGGGYTTDAGNGGTYGGGGGCGYYGLAGKGGEYGGNGGNWNTMAENGINTISFTNILDILKGYGTCGVGSIYQSIGNYGVGGGGYGGSSGSVSWELMNSYKSGGSGGGGYGGNSVNCSFENCSSGGGGYGGRGSGGTYDGGGGGYLSTGSYGGGGYLSYGITYNEMGGGGWNQYGTGGSNNKSGNTGICTIQYYIYSNE